MIQIRNYKESDAPFTLELFRTTIRQINRRHYTLAQVSAWAPAQVDIEVWRKRMRGISPFIAEKGGDIVGYADLQKDGYMDHFFCHVDHQGVGVGRALMEHILTIGSQNGVSRYYSEVSLTARPFFERFGFCVVKEQQVALRGQKLTNFVMEKLS